MIGGHFLAHLLQDIKEQQSIWRHPRRSKLIRHQQSEHHYNDYTRHYFYHGFLPLIGGSNCYTSVYALLRLCHDCYDKVTICLNIDYRKRAKIFGLVLINIYTHPIIPITFLRHSPSVSRFLGGGRMVSPRKIVTLDKAAYG